MGRGGLQNATAVALRLRVRRTLEAMPPPQGSGCTEVGNLSTHPPNTCPGAPCSCDVKAGVR